MSHEVYVIAELTEDESLPTERKICNDTFFFSRQDAEEGMEDYPPYMRNKLGIFTAEIGITEVSPEVPFTLPDYNSEGEEGESGEEDSQSSVDTSSLYATCKTAIVEWCENNRDAMDAELKNALSDEQFENSCDVNSWSTYSEQDEDVDQSHDYDENLGYCFECTSLGGDLRGYVKTNDSGEVEEIFVQGE